MPDRSMAPIVGLLMMLLTLAMLFNRPWHQQPRIDQFVYAGVLLAAVLVYTTLLVISPGLWLVLATVGALLALLALVVEGGVDGDDGDDDDD